MASSATHGGATHPTAPGPAAPSAPASPHTRTTPTRLVSRTLALWHLGSLDAPTVAALWTGFIAHTAHVPLPASSIAAMALAVWILYAADRLLDARMLDTHPTHTDLEPRHLFHHRHRTAFLTGIVLAAIALAPLLLRIPTAAIRLYLVEGTLLFAWFLLIHATRASLRLPKELAVGLFFAAAVFIPTVARAPALRLQLLLPALLFAALCSLNCLYIYRWEHPTLPTSTHPTTRLPLHLLPALPPTLILLGLAATRLAPAPTPAPLPAACALSATALALLHRYRHRLTRTTLRAAADLALLTPILFLGLHP